MMEAEEVVEKMQEWFDKGSDEEAIELLVRNKHLFSAFYHGENFIAELVIEAILMKDGDVQRWCEDSLGEWPLNPEED